MQTKLVKEYKEGKKWVREYRGKIIQIEKSFYILLPIEFIRTNNLKKGNTLSIKDNHDFLIIEK